MATFLNRTIRALAISIVAAVSCTAVAADLTGPARVLDGDTIEVGSQRIRIHGIDAPEGNQNCRDAKGQFYACATNATAELRRLTFGRVVTCEQRDTDRYGRAVAVCFADGVDVGEALVRKGLALAYRQYSKDYVDIEDAAKREKIGLWQGKFVAPWDHRRGQTNIHGEVAAVAAPVVAAAASTACLIKGNINRKGERIYHVPGGRFYDRTKMNTGNGERWFCTEEQAEKAGWRASRAG